MTTTVVECCDGLILHKVVVVEYDVVEADTTGQLEVVEHVPLILEINAVLSEFNLCCRILLAVVTVSKSYGLRCGSVEEVVE